MSRIVSTAVTFHSVPHSAVEDDLTTQSPSPGTESLALRFTISTTQNRRTEVTYDLPILASTSHEDQLRPLRGHCIVSLPRQFAISK
jgi:hypothetical protein